MSGAQHQLSQLEHRIHRIVELGPRSTDLEEIIDYLTPQLALGTRWRVRGAPPAPDRPVVAAAIRNLEKLRYLEAVSRRGRGDFYRVTPWGKATAVLRSREHWRQYRKLGRGKGTWRRAEALAQASELGIDRHEVGYSWGDLAVDYLDMAARSRNALARSGIRRVGDLAGMAGKELLGLKGIGRKSVEEIQCQLGSVDLELGQIR